MEDGTTAITVIDKVLGLLTSETISFQGVLDPEVVKSLVQELKTIRRIIKDIEGRDDDFVKGWLEKAADVAQRLELVIDTYLLHMAQPRNRLDFITRLISGRSITSLASEIRDIIKKLIHLIQRMYSESKFIIKEEEFQIRRHYWFERSNLNTKESEVVGIDSRKKQLLSMVVGQVPSTRLVIALVAVNGIGKTTLASSVYKNKLVRQHFHCYAWIGLSKAYSFMELLMSLTAQMVCSSDTDCICEDLHAMQWQELSSLLNNFLSEKRYLVVFDGVQSIKFWERMNPVFPDNTSGSRIIFTTRHNEIADCCDIVQNGIVLEFSTPSEVRALELFCKRAFRFEFEGKCPPELEELSLDFVRRCHGLPLVITTVADFLSTKEKVVSEWRKLLHQFNEEFRKMPFFSEVAPVIFSYTCDDLPFHIRYCLLYFGIFPKGFLIPDPKLFKLWIAEGFVEEETGKTLEQVAATYLDELINRNLVQVIYINYYASERMCSVPAFMYDLIFSRAADFGIRQTSNLTSSKRKIRRLSISGGTKNIVESIENSDVRSVFLFNLDEPISLSFVVNLFERFKLLEFLEFENAPLDYLPNEVGNLFNLKYLSLRNTKVKMLPKSVGLLLNLLTLDVRNTLMHELPTQILKLRKLQHLLASAHNDNITFDSIHGVRIKEGIGCLDNLQTLVTVQARGSGFRVIEEFEKLIQLRWLSISKLTAGMANILCAFIEKMNHLESLSLYSYSDHEIFYLESISSPPPSLRRLILTCRLEKLPDWVSRLQNLTVLCLSFSNLVVEPLKALQYLPNLVSLWLHRAYIGNQLDFVENSFKKLKQLILTELHNLRMMRIEEGALPILDELRIGPTSDEFSSDIQHLINLQVLEYYDMPDKYVLCLQPGGSAYWKVEHVPSVVFRYRVRGRRYASYKLGEPGLLTHVKGLFRTANVQWHDRPLSFFYKDDEELAATSSTRWSEQRSFFSDDIED